MKTCKRCGTEKPLTSFYKPPKASRRNVCRECWNAAQRERRARVMADPVKAAERRAREAEAARQYRLLKPDSNRAAVKRWKSRNVEARRAHGRVRRAIEAGKLTRPGHCELCHRPGAVHAHHPHHGNAMLVQFTCPACHKAADESVRLVRRVLAGVLGPRAVRFFTAGCSP